MRRLIKTLVICLMIGTAIIVGYQAYFSHDQEAVTLEIKGPFKNEKGHCWLVPLHEFAKWADTVKLPEFSTLIIYENGRALGPAHSVHEVIRKKGGGRFAHWGDFLYFSTSDNSNPNENGRQYVITVSPPSYQSLLVSNIIYSLLGATLAGAVVGLALIAVFSQGAPVRIGLVSIAVLNLNILYFCSANVVHPLLWYGKIIYIFIFLILLISLAGCFLLFQYVNGSRSLAGGRKLAFTLINVWSLLGIFVLLFEVFFRIFPVYDSLSLNPGIKFFWPDYVSYPLNTMGYRDRSFSLGKNPQTYRILVVGDSYTEGAGCRRGEAFPGVLEEALNKRLQGAGCPERVEVYNLGRCGANTVEEVEVILKNGPVLNPDLIILAYVINDPEVHPPDIKIFDPPAWVNDIHKVFLEEIHSYAYYWLFQRFTLFKGNITLSDKMNEYALAIHDVKYHGWTKAGEALSKLEKSLKEKQYDFLAVIFPEFNYKNYPQELRSVHKQVYQTMEKKGLEVIDLLSFYEGIDKNLRDFAFSAHDAHPNIKAHNLAGEYLAKLVWDRKSFGRFRAGCEPKTQQVSNPRQ